jgi:GH24 family phage-related lysozyme (muramidase)
LATDNEQLVLSISADVRQIQRQMKSLVGQTQRDTKAIEDAFSGIDRTASGAFAGVAANSNKAFTTAEQASKKFGVAVKASGAQTSNMAAQLQDIGVQLAGGQSPFLIGIQQLSQMNLGAMGVRGTLTAIGGAATTILSPINALGLAAIALIGYSVQYFSEWLSSGKATSAEIEKQAALVQKVAGEYGAAVPALREYADQLERAANAADRMEALKATRLNVESNFAQVFEGVTDKITNTIALIPDANREFGVLASKINSNSQTAEDFQRVIAELNKVFEATGSKSVRAAIDALEGLQAASEKTAKQLKNIDSNMNTVTLSLEQGKNMAAALTSQLLGLGTGGAGAIKQIAGAVTSYLGPAMQAAAGFADTFNKNLEAVGKSQGAAAQLIRNFESFSGKAYEDTRTSTGKFDAYRAGFGSDTTTRAGNIVEKVTKDTVVTLEDAERDLSRRIVEFQSGIQKAIGIETWRSLSDGQQAALTSIAYNYGSLPDSIVKAIEGGGGPEKVATAIAALTANPKRRKQEAESYLSGSGISMSEAGLGNKQSPADVFKGDISQVQKRIDVLNAEYAAQAKLNPLIDDYGYAVEKARIQQQLLSEAQKAGVTVTPEIAASIETLAENYARASAASDQLRDSQQRVAETNSEFRQLGRGLAGGFIDDLRAGKSAADALANALDKVADKLLDMALDSFFGIGTKGGGGLFGGGLLGGAIIPGILHSGGVAGSDGYGHGRSVSPGTFNVAKRYHTGTNSAGGPALFPGEVPAILKRGEIVIPKGAKMGGGSSFAPTYNIDARGADQAAVARLERGLQERDRTESKRVSGRLKQQDKRRTRA